MSEYGVPRRDDAIGNDWNAFIDNEAAQQAWEQYHGNGTGHQEPTPPVDRCCICGKPVPDYEPEFCCDGFECGCRGAPLEPCTCSVECEGAVFRYIGKPFDERRKLAGIELYN